MTESKHTPGPYFLDADDAEDCPDHANSGLAMIDTGRESDWPIARLMEWHNAKRVHACLTACEGIADPASLLTQVSALTAERDALRAALTRAVAAVDETEAALVAAWGTEDVVSEYAAGHGRSRGWVDDARAALAPREGK